MCTESNRRMTLNSDDLCDIINVYIEAFVAYLDYLQRQNQAINLRWNINRRKTKKTCK